MSVMKLTNIVRALFLPLTLCFLALGCILMLIGAANWFTMDPRQIQRDGLAKQLDFFSDCDLKGQQEMPMVKQRIAENRTATGGGSEAPSGGGVNTGKSSGADVGTMLASRCNTQQRPYKWLLLITGANVGLTFLLLLWMIYRAPSGLLNWLSIQCAIVLVLVILSIYAGMHLQAQTKDLVDCQGYDEPSRAEVEQLGFTCYSTANRPTSLKGVDHWSTIFWVGTGFAMGGLGLLMLLVPVMHWAKIRLAHQEGADAEEGYHERDRYGEHVGADYDREHRRTGADRSAWYNVGATDRDRYDRSDRDRDRYGRAGAVGTGLGLAGASAATRGQRQGRGGIGWTAGGDDTRTARDIQRERESAYGAGRQPSIINRMTGGYFDREHGGGPETRSTWFGGDRDREHEREREYGGRSERDIERDREAYGAQRQPSMLNRMTGGYFDREHGGGPESRHHRGGDEHEWRQGAAGVGGVGSGVAGRHLSEHEQALQHRGQYQPSFIDRVTGRDPNDPRGFIDRVTGRDPNDPRGLVDRALGRDEHRVGTGSAPYDDRSGTSTTYSHGGPTTSGGLQTGHTGEHVTTTTSQRQPATAQWGQDTASRPVDQQRTTTTTTGSGAV